jgi:hypothetical protein
MCSFVPASMCPSRGVDVFLRAGVELERCSAAAATMKPVERDAAATKRLERRSQRRRLTRGERRSSDSNCGERRSQRRRNCGLDAAGIAPRGRDKIAW